MCVTLFATFISKFMLKFRIKPLLSLGGGTVRGEHDPCSLAEVLLPYLGLAETRHMHCFSGIGSINFCQVFAFSFVDKG